jgi:hypothetical protein
VSTRPFLAHHHGFKCAGSTVVHLLNRNWPGKVLHIEGRTADRRIHCSQVATFLGQNDHPALTSHVLTMPPVGGEIAAVHFGLIRDPIQRLLSAYHFAPQERQLGGFLEFVAAHAHYACEFHARHLARQQVGENGVYDRAADWRANASAVPIGAPGVLIGLVERFEDSMFLLEQRLAKAGCRFDGSVGERQNVGKGSGLSLDDAAVARLRDSNRLDYELYARAEAELDRELAVVDPGGTGRAAHRKRCAARAGKKEPYLGQVPANWTYLDS